MGPEAGAGGGQVIAQGTVEDLCRQPDSQIGPYLSGKAETMVRPRTPAEQLFEQGHIHLSTGAIHTVKPLEADFPPRESSPSSPVYPARARPPWCWKA